MEMVKLAALLLFGAFTAEGKWTQSYDFKKNRFKNENPSFPASRLSSILNNNCLFAPPRVTDLNRGTLKDLGTARPTPILAKRNFPSRTWHGLLLKKGASIKIPPPVWKSAIEHNLGFGTSNFCDFSKHHHLPWTCFTKSDAINRKAGEALLPC